MKKIFAFLLLGLTVAFASCGDEKTETGTDWFLTPVAEVNGTTVGLSCQTRFGEGVLENTSVGFSYAAVVDNKIGAFADVAGFAVDGTGIAATLTGLQPETSYVVFAYAGLTPGTTYEFALCADWDGQTYTSAAATFTTSSDGGGGGNTGSAKYSGWPELVPEDKSNSDYYYAYHLCPDYPATGTKARNFSTCYSKSYRCPVWVAAPLHDCYTGDVKRTDAYRNDPDINCTQAGHWSGYTRGHMLGSNERRVTKNVNRDVFYYSNIGPQLQTYFNTGGGQWNTAEDWVDKQWRGLADTCYQVVGTYWENTPKVVDGTTIPTHYYIVLLKAKKSAGNKWVVNCSQGELQSIAIMVRHKTYAKNEVVKAVDFQSKGVFKTVAEIERLTGHTFFPNVPNVPKDTYNPGDWNF